MTERKSEVWIMDLQEMVKERAAQKGFDPETFEVREAEAIDGEELVVLVNGEPAPAEITEK